MLAVLIVRARNVWTTENEVILNKIFKSYGKIAAIGYWFGYLIVFLIRLRPRQIKFFSSAPPNGPHSPLISSQRCSDSNRDYILFYFGLIHINHAFNLTLPNWRMAMGMGRTAVTGNLEIKTSLFAVIILSVGSSCHLLSLMVFVIAIIIIIIIIATTKLHFYNLNHKIKVWIKNN